MPEAPDVASVALGTFIGLFLFAAVVTATGIAMYRRRGKREQERTYERLWIVPHRADEASPEDVIRLMERWHQQMLTRWWRRSRDGQPGLALEVVFAPDREGDMEARYAIVCPAHLATGIAGALVACYPDSRVMRSKRTLPELTHVVRLKKRHHFIQALMGADDRNDRNPMDSVLSQMASLDMPSVVQFSLVPAAPSLDRYSRRKFKARERRSEGSRRWNSADPGLRSEVLGRELEGGLRVQHRGLFYADIRVASTSYRAAAAIASAIRGETAAENRFVERYMNPKRRGPMYLRRLDGGLPNPFPSWRKGVLSAAELAYIWRLPSPGLRTVRMQRSAVPRLPAPPEVSRKPEHQLARDERGAVGIRPQDKSDGLGLIGGQKTGKTSLLCRTVQADALDPECALIVLMPKPGDALKALSMIPEGRVVHYLDLEKPEFGVNPLMGDGDPSSIADKVVDAFRDVHAEGDIKGSSDRYLRQAAQAAVGAARLGVIDGQPTLWHMYRILMPAERAFRDKIVEALYLDPSYTDTATFFGVELPSDLENAPGQTNAKLDAPRNKILRLLVESLDKVLRHPMQLSLDDVIARREVLIVDGKMGTFGSDNCRVMMQFLLNSLYGALQRQQQRPERERVRVALKVDEAHLILNESFADALATLRSAGLEVVAAWQYGDQITDEKIRSGMMSLLRQRCMFSMGESKDAREMSEIGMAVYSDLIKDDQASRSRVRVTPDVIYNMPNHHCVCSWISDGARAPAFVAQTIPLETVDEVVGIHLAAQRERGCYVPDVMPDPLPDLDWKGLRELPSEEIFASNGATATSNEAGSPAEDDGTVVAAGVALDFDPTAASIDRSNERAPVRSAVELPETFTELDIEGVTGLIWDRVTPTPADSRHEPSTRELEILAALWSYRVLYATQIRRRWWGDSSLRAAQAGLNRMAKAGWVRRFKFQRQERGAQQRAYVLTRLGFDIAQERMGRHGTYIHPEATWREPQLTDARRILRDLRVNGWVMAFEHRSGKVMRRWRGPRDSKLEPPRKRIRGDWRELAPADIVVGANHKLRDYEPYKFESISPDATLELHIPTGGSALRFDLLVELDRGRSAAASEDRLRRYDGLISGWAGALDRYRTLGTPPTVVFVCDDERSALALLKIADRVVTARLAKPGTEETEWPHPARRNMFFVAERDIHLESLEALQLPELPPDLRVKLLGRNHRQLNPRRVHIIEPRLLDMR